MTFSAREKWKEAEREVAMRRNVYKRRVASRSMSQDTADQQIAIMQAIADDYKTLAREDLSIEDLFAEAGVDA